MIGQTPPMQSQLSLTSLYARRSGIKDVRKITTMKVLMQSTKLIGLCGVSVRPLLEDREILFGVDCRWEGPEASVKDPEGSFDDASVKRAMDARVVQYKHGNYWLTLTTN